MYKNKNQYKEVKVEVNQSQETENLAVNKCTGWITHMV